MGALFSKPKMPKDTASEELAKRKKEEAAAKQKFLQGQSQRSNLGRQSTVLAQDNQDTTLLGG